MFGLFKKAPTAEELEKIYSAAVEAVKGKWVWFHQNMPMKQEVALG